MNQSHDLPLTVSQTFPVAELAIPIPCPLRINGLPTTVLTILLSTSNKTSGN